MKSQKLLCLDLLVIGCKSFFTLTLCLPFFLSTAQNNLPIGYLDNVNQSVGNGWAYDQDAGTLPIDVHIYINGRFYAAITANQSRPDLVSAGITPNPEHGYTFTITGFNTACAHEIVVYAINHGGGANPPLTNCPATIGTQPSGISTISNIAGPSNIVIKTTERLAGAIHSLTWDNKEFIDSYDHGRQLQSATSFDGHGECYNPTEAGCEQDGTGNTSTSFLQCLNANGNYLETQTLPAFWIQPGGTATGCVTAINTTERASHYFQKKVTIGMPGMAHVIKYDTEFDIPENLNTGTFEVVTGYMPPAFSVFRNYDPASQQSTALSDGPGEQPLPIMFSTTDNNHSMGIYSPDLPDPQWPGAGYGRFSFPAGAGNCTKWNCVFRKNAVPIGVYKFRSFVIVGSSTNVEVSMNQLYNYFIITANFSANAVCAGLPSTFTDLTTGVNTETTYQWDINNDGSVESTTSGNYSYTFPTAGTYQVKLTTINGVAAAHQSSVIINVVVLGPPTVGAISGNTSTCQGASQSYSIASVSDATSYAWTLPSGWSGSSTSTSINVTPGSSAGTISVTAINSCGTGSSSTLSVTINPLPPPPSVTPLGPTTFCQGNNVILDAGAGYSSYAWNNGINAQTNTITSSGNYSVIIIDGNGCSATSSATAVTVHPAPNITCTPPSSFFCIGDSVQLTASGANSYYWTPATGLNTSTGTNVTATPLDTKTYTIIGVSSLGCTNTNTITVTVNPLPSVIITQNGNTLNSSVTSGNQWDLNNTIIPGATSQNYTPTQSGNYTVTVIDSNGCIASSAVFNYTVTSLGTLNESQSQIIIYPNPNDGKFEVRSSKFKIEEVTIYNILWEKIYPSIITDYQLPITFNISEQPHGIYFVQLLTEGKVSYFEKISIQ